MFISDNAEGQIVETVVATLLNLIIEAVMGEGIDPVKVLVRVADNADVAELLRSCCGADKT